MQALWLQLGPALLSLCRRSSGEALGAEDEDRPGFKVFYTASGQQKEAAAPRQVFATCGAMLMNAVTWHGECLLVCWTLFSRVVRLIPGCDLLQIYMKAVMLAAIMATTCSATACEVCHVLLGCMRSTTLMCIVFIYLCTRCCMAFIQLLPLLLRSQNPIQIQHITVSQQTCHQLCSRTLCWHAASLRQHCTLHRSTMGLLQLSSTAITRWTMPATHALLLLSSCPS